jgi:hypothetical protein
MSQPSPLVQLARRREQERAASRIEPAEKTGQGGSSVRRDRRRRCHQVVPSGNGRGGFPGTRILWIPAESLERRGKRRLEMEVLEGRQRVSAGQMHCYASDEAKLPREEVKGAPAPPLTSPSRRQSFPRTATPYLRFGPKHA